MTLTVGGKCLDTLYHGNCKENVAIFHHTVDAIFVPNSKFVF